jgi:hypothetical protein
MVRRTSRKVLRTHNKEGKLFPLTNGAEDTGFPHAKNKMDLYLTPYKN